MGIDAEMKVIVPRVLTPEEVKKYSYIFGSAFRHYLFLGYQDKRHASPLSIDTDFAEYGFGIKPIEGKTVLDVPLAGRYYGEGYERGPIMTYIVIAEFLEKLFVDCEIYYFGDSGGAESAEPFDKARRDSLMEHFIQVQHEPYIRGFDSALNTNTSNPICPTCDVAMVRNGFGPSYAAYYCSGCGWEQVERDGKIEQGFELKRF